jgi:hypothetical protein
LGDASFANLANDPRWIASGEHTSRSDAHTGKNQRAATHPNVGTNLNWVPYSSVGVVEH